jgi:hypothetical protein
MLGSHQAPSTPGRPLKRFVALQESFEISLMLGGTAAATATLGWNQLFKAAIRATPSPPSLLFKYTFLVACRNIQVAGMQIEGCTHIYK